MKQHEAGGTREDKGFQLHKKPVIPSPSDADLPPAADPQASSSTDLDHLGELPHSYGSDTLFLVAQEPFWLFTYWDIDISHHPGGLAYLRVLNAGNSLEAEIEVPFESRNWYIPVKQAGSTYTVEIGYYRGENWKTIARSMPVQTPSDKLSDSEKFDFANIPLHLSFQKLTESIQTAIRSGESLLGTLARLQKEGQFTETFPNLVEGQRFLLESLLGIELLDELTSGGFGSEEIESRIRAYLEEKLSSPGASDLLSSEIFSGLNSFGIALSSEQVTSWDTGVLTSWATAALTSWTSVHEVGASWTAASSWTEAATTSWAQALTSSWSGAASGSWTEAAGASWGVAALSSWLHALQSSWFQASQTSWAAAALSSWNQAALTSWAQAAVSSWSGGSETLSSFGQPSREFFMHVNAEVIFYGGTDPQAKVTVDGHPIKLNHDGSFRYHFIFPNGTYEIPIVAVSPDGVETRSAVLRFDRGTQKTGGVDDTAQPPLGAPMGQLR